MSSQEDLPSLWTHEPHVALQFQPGQKVSDIDASATPGFRGDKSDDAVIELARKYAQLKHDSKGDWPGGKLPFRHPCPDRAEPKPPLQGAAAKQVVPGVAAGAKHLTWN